MQSSICSEHANVLAGHAAAPTDEQINAVGDYIQAGRELAIARKAYELARERFNAARSAVRPIGLLGVGDQDRCP